jgi:hypothetical protein
MGDFYAKSLSSGNLRVEKPTQKEAACADGREAGW